MSSKMRVLLTVLAIFSICQAVWGQPWGGGGVEGDPYLIYTAEDMQAVGADPNYWDAHFIMVNDINLAEYTGTQFNIIGTSSNEFTGVFDGNGHTISNFTWKSTGINAIGVFRYVGFLSGQTGGEIRDLGLLNVNIDAGTGNAVGALAGGNNEGTVSNCYATGIVDGNNAIGGLVGVNFVRGTISNCYAIGAVSGNENVGGLVGQNHYATTSDCYATVVVDGNNYIGGLVGINTTSMISNCYATGAFSGNENIGGLAGVNAFGAFSNCYSAGFVSGITKVGGLAGSNSYGLYTKCF